MRSVVSVTSLLAVLLSACPAYGECAPNTQEPRRAQVVHEGHPGMWFALEVSRCLLDAVTELELLRPRIGLLENRVVIRDDQIRALREASNLGDTAVERATTALARAERLRLTAEESARSAQRATRLWAVVGFAGGVLIVILAAWAWSAVGTP